MLIKSFKINHKKLEPGIYLHDVQQFGKLFVTTFDLRFKKPNKGDFLNNTELHSLEHMIATFYASKFPQDKIYFGPMGCQTGFYLVVAGQKELKWLEASLVKINTYINEATEVPGNSNLRCGNYKTLSLLSAKRVWNTWYRNKPKWGKKYR